MHDYEDAAVSSGEATRVLRFCRTRASFLSIRSDPEVIKSNAA